MIIPEKPAVDAKRAIRVKKRGNALGFWCFEMMFRVFGQKRDVPFAAIRRNSLFNL